MFWFCQKERQAERRVKKREARNGGWGDGQSQKGRREGNGGESSLSRVPGFTKFRSSLTGEIREARMKSQM